MFGRGQVSTSNGNSSFGRGKRYTSPVSRNDEKGAVPSLLRFSARSTGVVWGIATSIRSGDSMQLMTFNFTRGLISLFSGQCHSHTPDNQINRCHGYTLIPREGNVFSRVFLPAHKGDSLSPDVLGQGLPPQLCLRERLPTPSH